MSNVGTRFEPGNQLGRRHGCFAADVTDEALEVLPHLYEPEQIERYPALAIIGAQAWIRRRRALADIEARGMVLDGDKPHPLLKHLHSWERTILDLSTRFGLDPRSDLDLRRAAVDATRAGFDLDAAITKGSELLEAREAS